MYLTRFYNAYSSGMITVNGLIFIPLRDYNNKRIFRFSRYCLLHSLSNRKKKSLSTWSMICSPTLTASMSIPQNTKTIPFLILIWAAMYEPSKPDRFIVIYAHKTVWDLLHINDWIIFNIRRNEVYTRNCSCHG